MIELTERTWDTKHFGRKMGSLIISSDFAREELAGLIEEARAAGYKHLTARFNGSQLEWGQALAAAGFYLTDVGVTFAREVDNAPKPGLPTRAATPDDIPALMEMSQGLFLTSRFYHDPFFSREEADAMFATWAENSVRGDAADLVLVVDVGKGPVGYVTLRLKGVGVIVLIGASRKAPRGTGNALMAAAHRAYLEHGLTNAEVRTQTYNYPATRLYLKWGYGIARTDVTWCRAL
ncbi:MAG: GNAT family N-acetyltransferase [candidate division WOR-3 bacterium]